MYKSIEYLLTDQNVRQHLAIIGETIRNRNDLKLLIEKIVRCGLRT